MISNLKWLPDSTPTGPIQWDSSWPELVNEGERQYLLGYLEERFGIPEKLFNGFLLFKRRKSWHLVKDSGQILGASKLKVSKAGLKAFQRVGAFVKPTTRMIQVFGHAATKARFEINEEQLARLLAANELNVDLGLDKGYVILTLRQNRILGLGLFINGTLRSQIPRKQLSEVMLRSPSSEVYYPY